MGTCVVITQERMEELCGGFIGTSKSRFCLAAKLLGVAHCGIATHARSRHVVSEGEIYAPGAPNRDRPTAMVSPIIHRDDIPEDMKPEFDQAMQRSTADWISIIDEGLLHALPVSPRARASLRIETGVVDGIIEDTPSSVAASEHKDTDSVASRASSTDVSAIARIRAATSRFDSVNEQGSQTFVNHEDWEMDVPAIDWKLSDYMKDNEHQEWAPIAERHHALLHELLTFCLSVKDQVPAVCNKLGSDLWSGPRAAITKEMKALSAKQDQFERILGSVEALLAEHGSVASAVESSISSAQSAEALQAVTKADVESLQVIVDSVKSNHKVFKESMVATVSSLSRGVMNTLSSFDQRLTDMELARQPSSLLTHVPSTAPTTTLDTVLGEVSVGGNVEPISGRILFSKLTELQAKVDVQTDRANNGSGFSFHEWNFSSERSFMAMYLDANVSGAGPAAFVDINSIWTHASLYQATNESWLQTHHRSLATGFTNSLESEYASTFRNPYPPAFVGSSTTVLPTQVIHIFKCRETWRGRGVGDGAREHLLASLRLSVQRQKRYCEDNLQAGIVRETAIQTGAYTERALTAFFNMLDDQISMLHSLGLKEKQYMLLVTHEMLHMCDELFKFRQMAVNVDYGNKAATAARYAWVTLQALSKLDEFIRLGSNHPVFVGSFVTFLTRLLATKQGDAASPAPANTDRLEKDLAQEVRDRRSAVTEAVSKAKSERDKIDTKLEKVIKANSLKRNP